MSTFDTPGPSRRGHWIRRALRVGLRSLGWLSWILLLFALAMQGTHYGQHELEGLLRRRLDPLGSSVSLEGVRFDWLGPGLTVQELRVEKDGREHLYLRNIYVSAHFSFGEGIALDRVDIDQGRLLISPQSIEDVRALMNTGEGTGEPKPLRLPAVEIRAFEVKFEAPGQAAARLGEIELSMQSPGSGYSRIVGRVILPSTPGDHASPELFLSGLVDSTGLLEMHTVTRGLEVENWEIPGLPALDALRSLNPKGRISLHTTGSVQLNGDLAPRGVVRLRIEDGALQVPGTPEPVENIRVAFQASFEPAAGEDFWTTQAWRGGGQLQASWDQQKIMAGLRVGKAARPGLAMESWVQLPELLVETPALVAMESPELLPTLFNAVDPAGKVDARFTLHVASPAEQDESNGSTLEFLVSVDNVSPLTAAYHGWPDPLRPGVEPMSFALPAYVEQANVVFAYTPRFPRPTLVDVRWKGKQPSGPMAGSFQSWPNPIDMPPFAQGYGLYESDLIIHVPRLELNQELNEHLQGLYELPEVVRIFDEYGITQGTVAADLRIAARMELPVPAVEVSVQAHGVSATYADLPVPAHDVEGLVRVVDGGFGKTAVSFDVTGRTQSARGLHLAGRVRSEGLSPTAPIRPKRFDVMHLEVERFDLQGADLPLLGESLPGVQEAIGEFAPRGAANFQLTRTGRRGADIRTWTEVTPLGTRFSVRPQAFPMESEQVRGRVLVDIRASEDSLDAQNTEPPVVHTRTRISPLLATWRGKVPVGFHGVFDSSAASSGTVLGAALPSADRALIESLLQAQDIDATDLLSDLQGMFLQGAVDFEYAFEIPLPEAETAGRTDLHIRDLDVLYAGAFHVSEIRGDLTHTGERFNSKQLSARLGGTPFSLTNVELNQREDGFQVEADLGTRRLQMAPQFVRQFMDEETTTRLFDEFDLRGTLDVESGHVLLDVPTNAPLKLQMKGQATLSDAFLGIGVPISVRSARVTLEELVLEGEDLRGWGRIEDLYGQALGRDLAQTDMLLSYHDSQITVEQLDGTFCRGTISGLGSEGLRDVAPPVLSLDLLPPHRFRAGLQLSDVEVRLLLEDVFASGIADRGWLDAHFQLSGDLENLFDIRGSGSGRVSQTILWSVPVLRDLFSQLGLDESAIFDAMESDFEIADGVIQMEGMYVHSPILKLRGTGLMGFDGTLQHDLEVRYSLVDKAGPFGDIIHWLQNRLLAISIRGDMSRPKVLLRGVFSNPFTSVDDDWRALPSPGYSPLPTRF